MKKSWGIFLVILCLTGLFLWIAYLSFPHDQPTGRCAAMLRFLPKRLIWILCPSIAARPPSRLTTMCQILKNMRSKKLRLPMNPTVSWMPWGGAARPRPASVWIRCRPKNGPASVLSNPRAGKTKNMILYPENGSITAAI